jgi:hypothetical protein
VAGAGAVWGIVGAHVGKGAAGFWGRPTKAVDGWDWGG